MSGAWLGILCAFAGVDVREWRRQRWRPIAFLMRYAGADLAELLDLPTWAVGELLEATAALIRDENAPRGARGGA